MDTQIKQKETRDEVIYDHEKQATTALYQAYEHDYEQHTMSRSSVSFGDSSTNSYHRLSLPSIFWHRVGPDGDFMVSPIQVVDR